MSGAYGQPQPGPFPGGAGPYPGQPYAAPMPGQPFGGPAPGQQYPGAYAPGFGGAAYGQPQPGFMQGQPQQFGASGGLPGQSSGGQGFYSNPKMDQNPYISMNNSGQPQDTSAGPNDSGNNGNNGGKKGAEADPKKKGGCPFRNGEWKAPWNKK